MARPVTGTVLERLGAIGLIPVVTIDDAAHARELATALGSGGIPCAEITLRTAAGLAALAAIADIPGFIAGAGTVLTADQVDQVADAGAQFIVSPGFDADVVDRARDRGLAVLPGVATATEIQRALRAGVEVVKFFPADRLGGLPTIAALSAPFPTLTFVPSGGIGPDNAVEYLRHPAVLAVSGSWMVPRDRVAAADFDAIRELSVVAADLVSI